MDKQDYGKSHKEHFCKLAKKKKFEKIVKLANRARFICLKCGRVANCA